MFLARTTLLHYYWRLEKACRLVSILLWGKVDFQAREGGRGSDGMWEKFFLLALSLSNSRLRTGEIIIIVKSVLCMANWFVFCLLQSNNTFQHQSSAAGSSQSTWSPLVLSSTLIISIICLFCRSHSFPTCKDPAHGLVTTPTHTHTHSSSRVSFPLPWAHLKATSSFLTLWVPLSPLSF